MGVVFYGHPTRLLRGRTNAAPDKCSHPVCRGALPAEAVYVRQGTRHWAFCTVEHMQQFAVLSNLPDVHLDEMIEGEDWRA